jgi:hypothetical protein
VYYVTTLLSGFIGWYDSSGDGGGGKAIKTKRSTICILHIVNTSHLTFVCSRNSGGGDHRENNTITDTRMYTSTNRRSNRFDCNVRGGSSSSTVYDGRIRLDNDRNIITFWEHRLQTIFSANNGSRRRTFHRRFYNARVSTPLSV